MYPRPVIERRSALKNVCRCPYKALLNHSFSVSMSVLTRSQKRQREGDVAWNILPNTAKLLIIQFLSLPDLKNVLLVSDLNLNG